MNTPITDGLVLRLESINGVLVQGGVVVGWDDTSGSGNDLDQSQGDPILGAALTPTGEDAVVFDGAGDALTRVGNLADLPANFADRTMFIVTEYTGVDSFAGVGYGRARTNQAFGLIAGPSDELILQGWGPANDFNSNVGATTSGWMVHSVVLEDGEFSVYRDGVLIDSGDHLFNTFLRQISIGQNADGNGENAMSVSAVMIYDQALDVNERLQTEAYLRETYISNDGVDNSPLAINDTFDVLGTSVHSLDVLDNDFDDAALDPGSVVIVSGPQNGVVTALNPATGEVSYQANAGATADSFTYQVMDSAGNLSNVATVDLDIGEVPLFHLEGFTEEVVVSEGLGQPLSIAFLDDNRMIVIEKSGRVLIADPETGTTSVYMQMTNINSGQERGLLDITLDPDFASNGYFYVYYTPGSPQKARISRFTHEENSGGLTSTANPSSEVVLWQDTDGYDACCHYGGGLDFGPDGKLWLTTADKFNTSTPGEGPGNDNLPVDMTSTSGKIVRINKDGTTPDGTDGWPANPYIDLSSDPNNEIPDSIWAYGLRNPFRARWDEETGNMYVAGVGGNQAGLSSESIYIASLDQPGVFYGWPFYEGTDNTLVNTNEESLRLSLPLPDGDLGDPANGDYFSSPLFSYDRGIGASLTGGFVYRGDMFPEEWDGVYFYGDYTRDFIKFLVLDDTGRVVEGEYDFKPTSDLPGNTPNLVFIDEGVDGALYYINFGATGGQISRVSYDDGGANNAPVIAALNVTETGVANTYSFDATVSDEDADALTYVLQFGDGTSASGSPDPSGQISVEHTYSGDGAYSVSLQVSDGSANVFSSPQTVTVGDPNDAPEILNLAADAEQVTSGVAVNFSADAIDADGDAMSYIWVFGDGATETGVVDASGQVTASHAYATDGTYSARLEVSDGTLNTISGSLTVSVGETTAIPVSSGLVLLLESTIKIGLYGDTVTAWLDGSGNGNNFTATGDPQYVLDATPSGLPALVFDGDGDSLFRDNLTDTPIVGMPSGQGERSFFLVTKYEPGNDAYAGFAYGQGTPDHTFGLINAGPRNQLGVQGWGAQNDNRSDVNAGQQGWIVQSVVMQSDGSYIHYMNGVQIDSGQNDFDTIVDRIVIAANIGDQGETEMSVAAIAGFDRALSETERLAVEDYFQDTYLTVPEPTPPVATDDTFTAPEGTLLDISAALGLLANDEDADGDSLIVTQIDGVDITEGQIVQLSDGDLTIHLDGSFSFVADTGFSGVQSFAYTVSDNTDGVDTAAVSINITSAPIASDDAYTADSGTALSVDATSGLLANDSDADGDVLSITQINGSGVSDGETVALSDGDLTINADGSFTFTPDASFEGDQSFAYTVSDSTGATATATSTITVEAQTTDLPVTSGLVLSFDADENVTLLGGTDTVSSWLDGSGNGNDFAATGDPQYVLNATPSGHAAIVFDGDGDSLFRDDGAGTPISGLPSGQNARSFFLVTAYEPGNDAYAGFAYGQGTLDHTFGLINAGPRNQLGVQGWGAQNDNRSDVNAGQQGWIVQSVVMQSDGSYIHYMNGVQIDFGQNDFDTIIDRMVLAANIGDQGETAMSVAALVGYDRALTEQERLAVDAYLQNTYLDASAPTAPVALDDAYATDADTILTVDALQGLLSNDSDADGDPLTLTQINGVNVLDGDTVALANGDLSIDIDGGFTFTPDAGFSGDQSFDYTVADGVTGTDTATATISVAAGPPPNTPPVATDDAFAGAHDAALIVDAANGLLANDSDADGDTLTVTQINGVAVTNGETVALANGDLTINADGSFTFTPDAGFSGDQSFAYTLSDGAGGTSIANTVLTIAAPANTAPIAANDAYAVDTDDVLVVNPATGLLANDSDADGDTLSVTQINGVSVANGETVALANGDLTINTDGSFTFTPDAGFEGDQSFAYTVSDGVGGTATATSTVTVETPAPTGGVPVTAGLVVALDASENVAVVGGTNTVSGWLDGSGFGTDMFVTGDPELIQNATPTGESAIYLDGVGDALVREGGENLSNLPSGSADRTMFFVVDYETTSRMLGVVYGDNQQNQTFGLTTSGRTDNLSVQGWGVQNDEVSGTSSGNNDGVDEWLVQSVVLNNNQMTHYLNGALIDSATQTYATDTTDASSRLVIGEEIGNLGFGSLSVASVLIFDRALTDVERAEVEQYLLDRYITVAASQMEVSSLKSAPVMEFAGTDPDLTADTTEMQTDMKAGDIPVMPALGPINVAEEEFDFSGLDAASAPTDLDLSATMAGASGGSSVLKELVYQEPGLILDHQDIGFEDLLDDQILDAWDSI